MKSVNLKEKLMGGRYRRFDEATSNGPVSNGLSAFPNSEAASRSQSRPQSIHRNAQTISSASIPVLDLQKLRDAFDGDCRADPYTPALRIQKREPHCQWSNIKCEMPKKPGVRCLKICEYWYRNPISRQFKLTLPISIHNAYAR